MNTTRRRQEFKLLDEMASVGFLLSPFVSSQASMAEVFQQEPKYAAAERVVTFSIQQPPEAVIGYEPDAQLRLYTLRIESPPGVPDSLVQTLNATH